MIDESDRTALGICDQCGTRELRRTRAEARAWLAGHEAHAHPGHHHARHALLEATRRQSEMILDRDRSPVP